MVTGAGSGQVEEATAEDWANVEARAKAVSEKLLPFLPAPTAELTERMAWDSQDFNRVASIWGWGEAGGSGFLPVSVLRRWRFADPALVQQVAVAQTDVEEEYNRVTVQWRALEPRMKEKMQRIEELSRQGKYEEAIKLAENPDPEEEKLKAKQNELESRVPDLKARVRTLEFFIRVNEAQPSERPAGNLKGFPLYRRGSERDIWLSVYLGPPGFKAPPGPVRTEVKSILVRAWVNSRPETVKADETVARQMLEKVDYTGLAKLLQP